jgi:aminopeptidase N
MKRIIITSLIITTVTSLLFISYAQKDDIYKRPRQFERSRDYDAKHYRINLTFDLDKKKFWGTNTITLTSLKDNFEECVLDAEELFVTSVISSSDTPLEFKQTEKHLVVRLPEVYTYGDEIKFSVKYHCTDPQHGLFFDDEASDHPQMVSTISWPEYAHHWVPCYDYPNDKVTQETIVTVADEFKVLSNGRLVSVEEDGDKETRTYHWLQELPHSTYLFLLAIGPFAVIEDSLVSLPVNYWVYEKDVEDARWIFKKTPHMIDFFNGLYGYAYPWAKYDQVISSRMGGGAENTTATLLGEGVIHDKRAEQDFSWDRIIAHEIAHQWWGDLITLRSWEHTWLNESFATYSDYLYTNHDRGEDEGAYDLLGKKNQYLREAHTRYMRPIVFDRYDRPQQNFDSHTYPKGAAVLHMLRFILGDKPFFRTLKHFLHKHEFQAVDTHDFMIAVKEATGQNMDWFFEQYIFMPGHPVFDIGYQWDEESRKVKMKVCQVQDTSTGVPVYKVPAIIGIHTEKGKTSEKVWIEKEEQVFEFAVKEKPLLVRFDEGNYLLKEWNFAKSLDELLYQLENDDVIGRGWAAAELLEYAHDSRALTGLIKSARSDNFWAVRQRAVITLGKIKRKEDIDLFKEKCEETNSKVRSAAIQNLGDYGYLELVPFFRERFEKDDSYLVQAEALRSIGKCGDRSQLPFLEKAAKLNSPRNVIKIAAEMAIKTINEKNSAVSSTAVF